MAAAGELSPSPPPSLISKLGEEIIRILAPVSLCIFLVVLLTLSLSSPISPSPPSSSSSSPSPPWQSELADAVLVALIFVAFTTAITFLLVLLFYLRFTFFLRLYMAFSSFLVLTAMGGELAALFLRRLRIPLDFPSFVVLLLNFAVVGAVAALSARGSIPIVVSQGYLVLIGALVAFWFTMLPEWTTWALLVAMSVYDLAAVLLPVGPLRLLVELAVSRDEEIPALVYEARPVHDSGGHWRDLERGAADSGRNQRSLHGGDGDSARNRRNFDGGNDDSDRNQRDFEGGLRDSVHNQRCFGDGNGDSARNLRNFDSGSGDSVHNQRNFGDGNGDSARHLRDFDSGNGDSVLNRRNFNGGNANSDRNWQNLGGGRNPDAVRNWGNLEGGNANSDQNRQDLEGRNAGAGRNWGNLDGVNANSDQNRRNLEGRNADAGRNWGNLVGGNANSDQNRQNLEGGDVNSGCDHESDTDPDSDLSESPWLGTRIEVEDGLRVPLLEGSEDWEMVGLSSSGGIKLGLGDFIFYSVLVARAAMFDMAAVYACYLAIVAGLGLTLLLLAFYRRALPALPISIALGGVFYLLSRFLLDEFLVQCSINLVMF